MACPCLGMCEWTLYGNHAHYGHKTQPISVSHTQSTPQAPAAHARASTSTLYSVLSNASPLFSDDELAVLSKGVVASMY